MRRRALVRIVTASLTLVAAPVLAPSATAAPVVVRHLFDATPNDPYFSRQADYLGAVDAPAAWAREHGSSKVVIAIVDSGIDVHQPDLRSKIIGTYNAVEPASRSIADPSGHGTFVAGVAAADTGNGHGVSGAALDTRLLGVKVTGPDGSVSIAHEVAGIRWAADHHADVINLSLGGPDYSLVEARAVAYAQAEGALVVAAAGNSSSTVPQYPAAYPGVIAVAATDTVTHTRAAFSGHGSWVDVAAPGVGIVSTTPPTSRLFGSRSYATSNGTSFATPIVSAEAALLKAQNPTLSVGQLRSAVIGSAHGYRHLGLGAGQVDFTRGLDRVRTTNAPTTVTTGSTSDSLPVSARSSGPAVEFRIDSGSWSAPVAVQRGVARTDLDTDGYVDGRHTVTAMACTLTGQCSPPTRSSTIDVHNRPGQITTPLGAASVTGRFTVTARRPGAGQLRLLIDGVPDGAPTRAPFVFRSSASELADGSHTLQVQLCSTDGVRCDGAVSAPVDITSAALHPGTPQLMTPRISPNGDGVSDRANLDFWLPDTESVDIQILDAAGVTVAHSDLGRLAPGSHGWTWTGTTADGTRLPDGRYTLALATSRQAVRGWTSTTGVVDTVAPTMTGPTGAAATFYPYPDDFADVLRPTVELGGAGTLALHVLDAGGHPVRTITEQHGTGRASVAWDGTDATGNRVPAGRYAYRITITDAAGNSRSTPLHQVTVSSARLHRRSFTVTARAGDYSGSGATASCARLSTAHSRYRGGALFTNACPAQREDLSSTQYEFTVPAAARYDWIAMDVYGRARTDPAHLTASLEGSSSSQVALPLTVALGAAEWYTVTAVPAKGHLRAHRQVVATLALAGASGMDESFDAAQVRVRIDASVLY